MTVSTISNQVKLQSAIRNCNGDKKKAIENLIDMEMATYNLSYDKAKAKVNNMIKEVIKEMKEGM